MATPSSGRLQYLRRCCLGTSTLRLAAQSPYTGTVLKSGAEVDIAISQHLLIRSTTAGDTGLKLESHVEYRALAQQPSDIRQAVEAG